jgi:hypothetical protein
MAATSLVGGLLAAHALPRGFSGNAGTFGPDRNAIAWLGVALGIGTSISFH